MQALCFPVPRANNGSMDGGRHLQSLRAVARALEEPSPATSMPEPVLPALRDLIGFDSAGFVGLDTVRRTEYLWRNFAPGYEESCLDRSDETAMFWEHKTSGTCRHPRVPTDQFAVLTETDGISARRWHTCQLYVDVFKPNGDEHMLELRIPDGPGRTLRLICWRGPGLAFSERDRTDLYLLRPHVEAAHRRNQHTQAVADLTPRQRQLLILVEQGLTNYQVARQLHIAEGTVRAHLNHIYSRLGVTSRTGAVTASIGLRGV